MADDPKKLVILPNNPDGAQAYFQRIWDEQQQVLADKDKNHPEKAQDK